MTTRTGLALTVAAAVAAAALGAAPARADDEIGLSLDGRHWSDELRRPLFDPGFRWVPGDTETRSFFVRNEGPSDARMTVRVVSDDPAGLLADEDIDLRARAAGSEWVRFSNGQDVTELVEEAIGQGGRARIDVRVAFDPSSTNQSMSEVLPLEVVVTLTEDGPLPDDGNDEEPDGILPGTGGVVDPWVVVLGAALLAGGIALLAGRRRGERADG
jgi:LPXTG-motif cell wall-anchored protein